MYVNDSLSNIYTTFLYPSQKLVYNDPTDILHALDRSCKVLGYVVYLVSEGPVLQYEKILTVMGLGDVSVTTGTGFELLTAGRDSGVIPVGDFSRGNWGSDGWGYPVGGKQCLPDLAIAQHDASRLGHCEPMPGDISR